MGKIWRAFIEASQVLVGLGVLFAMVQYSQTVQQNKLEATLALINVHSNERFFDTREQF